MVAAVLRIFVKSFGTQDKPGGQSQFGPTVIEVNGINYCKKASFFVHMML